MLGFLIVLWLSALVECIRTKDFKVGKPSLLLLIWFAAGVALCAVESLAVYMIKYMDFSNSIPILPVRIGGYALRLAVALGAGLFFFGGRKSRWMGIIWVVIGILTIFKIAQPFLGIARIPAGSYLYPLQGYNWNRCIAAEGLLLAAGILALRRPAKTVKQTTGETV